MTVTNLSAGCCAASFGASAFWSKWMMSSVAVLRALRSELIDPAIEGRRSTAKRLTRDEARRMAVKLRQVAGAVAAGGLFAIDELWILSGLRMYCSDRSLPPSAQTRGKTQ